MRVRGQDPADVDIAVFHLYRLHPKDKQVNNHAVNVLLDHDVLLLLTYLIVQMRIMHLCNLWQQMMYQCLITPPQQQQQLQH